MQTNDALFYKEFKEMMAGRRAISGVFNIRSLPLPPSQQLVLSRPKKQVALIRGIKEPFFERLNKEEVQLLGRVSLKKRQVMSDGNFRKDSEGNYVYTQIAVPRDSVAIISAKSIGLRRFIEVEGVKREHKVSDGYKYVDYIDTKAGRRYIYIVPRQFVYRLNMYALIITPNKHRIYFKGSKLALQNGHYVYMYVIPYSYRDNLGYRILGVKSVPNFDKEVSEILKFWMEKRVLFNLNLTKLSDNVKGISNLGIEDLDSTCTIEDFTRYTVSLAEEKEEDFINSFE